MDIHAFYRGRRVLITGGLGFIGSSIAHTLVPMHAHVTVYEHNITSRKRTNIREIESKIKVIEGDIRHEEKINRALKEQAVIFNLAGLSSHVGSNREPMTDMDVNLKGQLTLLDTAKDVCPRAKIVFAGSRAQYGVPRELPVTEETPMHPVDIYGVHKLIGEHYHFLYAKHQHLRVTVLRKTNTFGPRHQMRHAEFGVQNYFIRLALDNQPITLYEGGRQLRDYVYIDDVVRAYLLAGSSKKADGNVYLLASGAPITLREYAKKVIQYTGAGSLKNAAFPKERKSIEIGDYYGDASKIKRELGWKPTVSLDEGLKKTLSFYRKYRKDYW